jgi:hypothetical protein
MKSRSRRGGMWPFTGASSSNNSYGATTGSTSGSWWDELTGKKPQTGMNYGSTGMNQSYNSPMNASYGAYNGMGSNGMGSNGMNASYGATGMGYGGKRKRKMRGGSVTPNVSLTNLASRAAPVSGIDTVKAQTWVGGRTKRRRHRHSKSCKKSCRKH